MVTYHQVMIIQSERSCRFVCRWSKRGMRIGWFALGIDEWFEAEGSGIWPDNGNNKFLTVDGHCIQWKRLLHAWRVKCGALAAICQWNAAQNQPKGDKRMSAKAARSNSKQTRSKLEATRSREEAENGTDVGKITRTMKTWQTRCTNNWVNGPKSPKYPNSSMRGFGFRIFRLRFFWIGASECAMPSNISIGQVENQTRQSHPSLTSINSTVVTIRSLLFFNFFICIVIVSSVELMLNVI